MSKVDEAVHGRIAELAAVPGGGRVVDLGCGEGPTLRAVSRRDRGAVLVGLDRHEPSLGRAADLLASHGGPVGLVAAELAAPLPVEDASVDAVVSYNVLECLPDLAALLREVARVLRPGGRAVLAHVDFDSLVLAGAPAGLDRRVCHAYCDDAPAWMDRSDGRMGRRLPGLVARSPLVQCDTVVHATVSQRLDGHAADRVGDVRAALLDAERDGRGRVTGGDVEEWVAALREADREGCFFFAESAVVVVAERPS